MSWTGIRYRVNKPGADRDNWGDLQGRKASSDRSPSVITAVATWWPRAGRFRWPPTRENSEFVGDLPAKSRLAVVTRPGAYQWSRADISSALSFFGACRVYGVGLRGRHSPIHAALTQHTSARRRRSIRCGSGCRRR
jgi:hypothetical protein